MRLLILEDTCGAGYRHDDTFSLGVGEDSIASLMTEGAAMLRAVVEDFAKLSSDRQSNPPAESFEIVTHWDQRGGEPLFDDCDSVQVVQIDSAGSGQAAWRESLKACDAVLIIAPEYHGRSYELRQDVARSDCLSLNSSASAIKLCSDKLELCRHLQAHNISTIPTYSSYEPLSKSEYVVAKSRDGVGSLNLRKLPFIDAKEHSLKSGSYDLIWQPYVTGAAYSVGCFLNSGTKQLTVLPTAKQLLSDDGRFSYLGGIIPAVNIDQQAVRKMATQVVRSIPGLQGYFGIDFISGEDQTFLVVEVNPRLTTSYVGYRAMTSQNLAELFLNDSQQTEIEWQNHVSFQPNGTITTRPLTEVERECCWH